MNSNLLVVWEKGTSPLANLDKAAESQLQAAREIVSTHGALLLRGYDIDTSEQFANAVAIFGGEVLPYVDGTSPRRKFDNNVYSSTEYPPHASISLHNEQSYAVTWPARLFFCCVVAPLSGGHTLLGNSAAILQDLDDPVRSAFKDKGVTYVRNLHGGKGIGLSWQATFETKDRSVVEDYCAKNATDFRWKPDGGLQLVGRRPATAIHDRTRREVWFNQADQFHPSSHSPDVYEALTELYGTDWFDYPTYACFGDGSPIPNAMLDHVRAVAQHHAVLFDWQKGDFLIIDNLLASHGRSPFTGDRTILVALTA